MNRRRFLAITGAGGFGLFLPGAGLIEVPSNMVLHLAGNCSFCHKPAREIAGLAGVVGRDPRICDECVRLCLEIIGENQSFTEVAKPEALVERQDIRDVLRDLGLNAQEIEAFLAQKPKEPTPGRPVGLACSFCDLEQDRVDKLIAGPAVYSCGRCIADAGTLLIWSGIHSA